MNRIRLRENEYLNNLEDIKKYIKYIKEHNSMFDKLELISSIENVETTELIQHFHTVMKTPVAYNAVIISLYGCFEDYIDKLANSLLEFWEEKSERYNDIPEKIRNKHINKSGEFLSNPQRFKNYELKEADIIRNLYDCLGESDKYRLSKELLVSHGGNLNIGQLTDLFIDLGINNCQENIIKNDKFIEFIAYKHELPNEKAIELINNKQKEAVSNLFEELNLLIEQRNKVAHGWCVDARLSFEILEDNIIPFIEMIGKVIADIFEEEFVDVLYKTNRLHEFDEAICVYDNNILCINSKNANLKKNGYIFVNNGKRFIALEIMEIQHNKKSMDEITKNNVDIGIKVDKKIKKGWSYYYS